MSEDDEGGIISGTVAALKTLPWLPVIVLAPLLSAPPATWRLFHKLHKWSAYQMQKAAGADSLAHVRRRNGHEDVLPAKWVEGDEDEKDLTGWRVKTLGDKRYDPAVHGRSTSRLGKADIIQVNEDSNEQGTWAEAAIDNALQLDREKYLFHDARVTVQELVYPNGDGGGGASQPVADGGQQQQYQTMDVSVDRPGVLMDCLVPLASRNGYDGQVVSMAQYRELKKDQSGQEKIRQAKNSAWAAAKLDEVEGKDLMKWVLILGAIGAILLFHAEIGAFIAGLSGGGGGVSSAVGGGIGMMAPVGGI